MITPPVIKIEIIHIDGPHKGTIQEFHDSSITIGRHPECHVTFPREMTDISRRHAEIRRDGNRFFLADHSTNGTQVNGKLIQECILKDGDVITLSENGPKISFLTTIVDTPDLSTETAQAEQVTPDNDLLGKYEAPLRAAQPEHERSPSNSPAMEPAIATPPPIPAPAADSVHTDGPADPIGPIPTQTLQKPFVIQFGVMIKSFHSLPITIGRAPGCEFTIDHPAILGEHAQIYFSGGAYHIKDLTGRNLVTINSRPVEGDAPMPPDTCIALSQQGPLFQFIGEGRLAEIDISQQPGEDGAGEKQKKSFWPFKKKY